MKTPNNPDKTISNTFKQDSLKLPIPTPRYEKYTQQVPLNVPLPQMSIYEMSMSEKNIFTQSKILSVEIDTFGHIRKHKYTKNENFMRDKDVSEHISDQLHRTAQLVRKCKLSRNDSQSNLSDYASSTSSSVQFLNKLQNHPVDV